MIHNLVVNTLVGLGIDVIDLGLSTTPTVEIAVPLEQADGGIILTASHNPKQWNALKLLNAKGEFLSGADGAKILELAEAEAFNFAEVDDLGIITENQAYMDIHIDEVLALPLVNIDKVKSKKFKVVVDGVNSSGGIIIPKLLEEMGVEVVKLYCEPNGHFPHNPEPLKEHLGDICKLVVEAVQWTGHNISEVVVFAGEAVISAEIKPMKQFHIGTLEGPLAASVGDYIIKGVKGEFYPCKPDIFEMTYEVAE